MAQPFQRQTEVLLRAVAGCSVLSSCLVASAATTYDLSGGGALQVAAPVYVVDFTTSAPADPGLATTSGLGGSGGSAGYDASRADGLPVTAGMDLPPVSTTDVVIGQLGAGLAGSPFPTVLSLTLNGPQFTPLSTVAGGGGLSLNAFQVYVASSPLQDSLNLASLRASANLVFDLDHDYVTGTATDRSLLLNVLNAGDSNPDLYVHLPAPLFEQAGATEESFVYVYSEFGGSGFDVHRKEWAYLRAGGGLPGGLLTPAAVPEASTWVAACAMAGLLGGTFWIRRTRG